MPNQKTIYSGIKAKINDQNTIYSSYPVRQSSKPMHMQPIYRTNPFVTREGVGRARTNAYLAGAAVGQDGLPLDAGMDIFHRGLCLPSDNKMTVEQQDRVIEIIYRCFA